MPQIDKRKPLPPHTKLDYYECYAKIVLEDLFPSAFSELLLKDKPDLQDMQNQVGIEVAIAETRETMETQRLYSTLPDADDITKLRIIERIEQCGAIYAEGILFGPNGSDDFTLINHAIGEKVKKLRKSKYEIFNEYQLFVFSSIMASDDMLRDELNYLKQREVNNYFKRIYINVPEEVWCFDLIANTYESFSIDTDRQSGWAKRARKMVEDGERV